MNVDEIIDVLQAFKAGKNIMQKYRLDLPEPFVGCWVFDGDWKYFVKPEPKVIWVNEYDNLMAGHNSESSAIDGVKCGDGSNALDIVRTAVKYIEMTDE